MSKGNRKIKELQSFDSLYELKNKIRALSDTEKLNAFIYYDSNNKQEYLSIKLNIAKLIIDDYIKTSVIKRIKNENDILEVATTLKKDENKIKVLDIIEDKCNNKSYLKGILISSFKKDEYKLMFLDDIEYDKDKIKVIVNLKNDEDKLEMLGKFSDITKKAMIVESLENDKYKVKFLEKYEKLLNIKDREGLIFSLKNDKNRIKFIEKLKKIESKIEIIKSLQNDKMKVEYLKEYEEELDLSYKLKIIASMNSDKLKLIFVEKTENVDDKAEVIETLHSDNLKIDFLEYNKEILNVERQKGLISSLKSDNMKIKLLSRINDEQCKLDVIKTIKNMQKMYEALLITEKSNQVKLLSGHLDKKQLKIICKKNKFEWYEILSIIRNHEIGKNKLEHKLFSKTIQSIKYFELLIEVTKNPNLIEKDFYSLLNILDDFNTCESINNYKNKYIEKNINTEEIKNKIKLLMKKNIKVTDNVLKQLGEMTDYKNNTKYTDSTDKLNQIKKSKKLDVFQRQIEAEKELWNKLVQGDDKTKIQSALNEKLSKKFIELLKNNSFEDVRLAFLQNKNISIYDKLDMIEDDSEKVRLLLIYELYKTEEEIKFIEDNKEEMKQKENFYKSYIPFKYREKLKLAKETKDEKVIEKLMQKNEWYIDLALIYNKAIKKENILEIASRTKYIEIITEIFENPKLDSDSLIKTYNNISKKYLTSDRCNFVSITNDENISKNDSKLLIYRAIAKNSNADKSLLENIYFDCGNCDENIKLAILENKNVTKELVKFIETDYTSPEWILKIEEAAEDARQRIRDNIIDRFLFEKEVEVGDKLDGPKEKLIRKLSQIHYEKENDKIIYKNALNIIKKLKNGKIKLNQLPKETIEKLVIYSKTPNEIITALIEMDNASINQIFMQKVKVSEETIEMYIKERRYNKKTI